MQQYAPSRDQTEALEEPSSPFAPAHDLIAAPASPSPRLAETAEFPIEEHLLGRLIVLQQGEEERSLRIDPTADGPKVGIDAPEPRAVTGGHGVEKPLISFLKPSSFEAEQNRTLSHFAGSLAEIDSVKVVGITSPVAGDGETVTAFNLAGILEQGRRKRVLVLEADLRQPVMAKYVGVPKLGRGFAHLIAQPDLGLTQAVTRLPSGRCSKRPSGLRRLIRTRTDS